MVKSNHDPSEIFLILTEDDVASHEDAPYEGFPISQYHRTESFERLPVGCSET